MCFIDLLRNIKFSSNCLLRVVTQKSALYLAGVNGILYLLIDLDEICCVKICS